MDESKINNSTQAPQENGVKNAHEYVVGHRGAGNHAPGSTIAALEKAKELGLAWAEFDVRLTADGHLVIANADDLLGCSGQSIKISESTLAELSSVNVGHYFEGTDKFHAIPSFEEAIQFCLENGIRTQIELKAEPGTERTLAEAVMQSLRQEHIGFPEENRPLITSFSPECLLALKNLQKKAPHDVGLLIHTHLANQWEQTAHLITPDFVHFYGGTIDNGERLTETFGDTVRTAGYQLNGFKINTVQDAKAAIKAGTIRFTSDEPETLINAL